MSGYKVLSSLLSLPWVVRSYVLHIPPTTKCLYRSLHSFYDIVIHTNLTTHYSIPFQLLRAQQTRLTRARKTKISTAVILTWLCQVFSKPTFEYLTQRAYDAKARMCAVKWLFIHHSKTALLDIFQEYSLPIASVKTTWVVRVHLSNFQLRPL